MLGRYVLTLEYRAATRRFLSPSQFYEFVAPFLARRMAGYRAMGFSTTRHCNDTIMLMLVVWEKEDAA